MMKNMKYINAQHPTSLRFYINQGKSLYWLLYCVSIPIKLKLETHHSTTLWIYIKEKNYTNCPLHEMVRINEFCMIKTIRCTS